MVHMRDERLITILQQTSRWAGVTAIAVGCMVIVGWQFEFESFKRVLPGLVAMNPLTAIAFILSGIALLLSHPVHSFPPANLLRTVLAVLIVGIGASRLLEIALNITIGLDQLLFTDRLASPAEPIPNRMAPNTALAFLILGMSLALLGPRSRYNFIPAQSLAILVGMIALLAIAGYFFGVFALIRVASFIPIALNTALLFLVMSLGVMCARPESGFMHILTQASTGGILTRRLLIVAFAVPFTLSTLLFVGERAGYYDTTLEIALSTVSITVMFMIFVLWTGNVIHRIDSERKEAEEKIRKLNETLEQQAAELQEVNKQLEAFSYSVSHDLRAPLRAIDGFSKLLVEEYGKQVDEEGRRLLSVIQTNTRQMGQLIDDLLAFSRISRSELRGQEISMTDLARTVADELLHRHPERRIDLALNDLPPAWGDPAMVKQVVVNLLSNAIKFTAPRGDAARIEIGGERNGDMCQYSVRDNGVGFDMRFADKLFGVFQRLHSPKEFEGTGVWLAIVHRVVTRHGGIVTADSDHQRGTTFTFTLPARSIS